MLHVTFNRPRTVLVILGIIAFQSKSITIILGGDIMLNGVPVGRKPLHAVSPIFKQADVSLANLEVPLTNAKTATTRKTAQELKKRSQFILKADPKHIDAIAQSGLKMVSLGNNHAMDYGKQGIAQETTALNKAGILFAGAGQNAREAYQMALCKTPQGVRVGLISALAFMSPAALRKCTPSNDHGAGVAVMSFGGNIDEKAKAKLESWIGNARSKCDFLIVAFHWGVERKTAPNSYQKALGRAAVDAGADLVWGHHPHVLQGMELYNDVPIFYSMGNLVSPMGGETALAVIKVKDRHVKSIAFEPLRIQSGRVTPINGKDRDAALKRISGLSKLIKAKKES